MLAVSHLVSPPFTQEVVRAFLEAGKDTRFLTTLTPDSTGLASGLLRASRTQSRRLLSQIPRHAVDCYPWRDAVRLALGRARLGDSINDSLFHWARNGFDAWVARKMKPPLELIYAHETECLLTFNRARSEGIRTIYDLPSPEHDHVENLLWQEIERFPELCTPARRRFRAFQAERTARRHREFELSEVVIANSKYTRDTWAAAGLDGRKILIVPYGSPPPDPTGALGGTLGKGPLRLIWVGTFSIRKGAHYLLEAWQKWSGARQSTLDVFGTVSLPAAICSDLPGVRFHGPVPREQVLGEYMRADALVFPTLCDGFGMVVNEALSRGLPVITTRRAGAADLIESGRNGLIVEPGSSAALTAALTWCAENRDALTAMRASAIETAAKWQWSDYRKSLVKNLRDKGVFRE